MKDVLGAVGNWGINILRLMVIMAVPQVCCYLLFHLPPPKRSSLPLQRTRAVVLPMMHFLKEVTCVTVLKAGYQIRGGDSIVRILE